jgi:hypothetical protein
VCGLSVLSGFQGKEAFLDLRISSQGWPSRDANASHKESRNLLRTLRSRPIDQDTYGEEIWGHSRLGFHSAGRRGRINIESKIGLDFATKEAEAALSPP